MTTPRPTARPTPRPSAPRRERRPERRRGSAPESHVRQDEWRNPVDRARDTLSGTYRRLSRRGRRALWVGIITPLLLLATSTAANAGDGMGAPSALSWIQVKDSRDTLIWQYELSLDRGGVTSPGKLIWSFFVEIFWGFYQCLVAISIWLVDWVLDFGWLDLIAAPVVEVGDAMKTLVDALGVGPTFLTITAAAGAWMMIRGKFSAGIFEIAIACLISALSLGMLADPVRDVVEDGGVLTDSRDAGLVVASSLQNDGTPEGGSSDELRAELTATMTDTFIRLPFQLVNFGEPLDGTDCEDTFQDTLRSGPYGGGDELREAVKDCNEDAGKIAENPNLGMATSAGALVPAGGIALLFTIVLAGVVLVAGVQAAYQALKMIVALLLALLPGGARGSLWRTAADLLISLAMLMFAVVFLAVYVLMIAAVFAGGSSGTLQSFIVVDLMMVVGLIIFWKGRARLKAASDRLAAAFAQRPGSGPTALPARSKFDPTAFYYKARMARGALTGTAGKVALGAAAVGAAAATGGTSAVAGLALRRGAGKVGSALSRGAGSTAAPAGGGAEQGATAGHGNHGGPGEPPTAGAGAGRHPSGTGGAPAGTAYAAQAGQRLRDRVTAAHAARGSLGRIISTAGASAPRAPGLPREGRTTRERRIPVSTQGLQGTPGSAGPRGSQTSQGGQGGQGGQSGRAGVTSGRLLPTTSEQSPSTESAESGRPASSFAAAALGGGRGVDAGADAAARLRARLQHDRPQTYRHAAASRAGLAANRRG